MDTNVLKYFEEYQRLRKDYLRGLLEIIRAAVLTTVIFIVFILALQVSLVQKQVFNSFSKLVAKYTDYQIDLEHIEFGIFNMLYIKNLVIIDDDNVPLITAQSVKISFNWLDLFTEEAIIVEQIELTNSHFYLQYKGKQSNIAHFSSQMETLLKNLNSEELKTLTLQLEAPSDSKSAPAPSEQHLILKAIDITNSYFHYCNNPKINGAAGFSFDDINVLIQEGRIRDFQLASNTLSFDVLAAKGEESQRNFRVEDLKTKFLFSDHALKFSDVEVKLKNHYLKSDSINFTYANSAQLKDFDSLNLAFNIRKSRLSLPHLAWIFEPFKNYKDTVNLNLTFEKQGQSLHIQNLDANFGQQSQLKLKNFFSDTYKNWIIADYNLEALNLTTTKPDLDLYLPTAVSQLLPAHYQISEFECDLNRSNNRFQAKGAVKSDLLKTSFETHLFEKKYRIDLGLEFIDVTQILKLDLPLDLHNSHLKLTGQDLGNRFTIDSLELQTQMLDILEYKLSNLALKGTYQQNLLKLDYHLRDTNLSLTASNYIDFGAETLSGNIALSNLDFQAFKLIPQPLKVKAENIAFAINSFDLKRSNGRFRIDNIILSKPNLNQNIPYLDLDLESNKQLLNKQLYIRSSILDAQLNIDIPDTSHLAYMFRFIQNFKRNLLLKANLDQYKYFGDYPYQLEVFAKLHHINPVLNFFNLPLQFSRAAELNLELNLNDLNYFKLRFQSDSLRWADFVAKTILLDVDMLETADDNFDIDIGFESQAQTYKNLKNEHLKLIVNSDSSRYNFQIKNKNQAANEVDLLGQIDLVDSNTILIHLDTSSTVHFLDTFWTIKPNHKIAFSSDTVLIEDFELALDDQLIRIEAELKHRPEDYLTLSTQQVKLKPLSNYLGKAIDGYLNFDFDLYTPYETPRISAQGTIDSLLFRNFSFDTLFVSMQQAERKLSLKGYLKQDLRAIIAIDGLYEHDLEDPFIDLRLVLRGMPLEIIEPFVERYISELEGGIAGVVLVQGDLDNPQINGDAYVVGGQFKINYLNTLYKLTDRFYFKNNDIFMKNIRLTDENKRTAILNGTIRHHGLTKFTYDLKLDLEEFIVMDIPESNEALYYGLATMTGNMTIKTNPSNLIDLSLKGYTGQNTQVFFPFSSSSLSEANALEQSYITFLKDTTKLVKQVPQFKPKKQTFTLAIDLKITPNAHVQMIFDRKKGDIIRGQGRGNLLMKYDEKGNFSIFGDVNVVKGDYHFTLLNLIDKKFIIEPDSRITWSGDPYNAQLNMRASYNQRATLLPILEEYERTDLIELPESKVQYPVKVLLFLKGYVEQPDIEFGIDFENYPRLFQDVLESFKHKISFDLQERNKQVFSLIALKRFAQQSKFSVTESAGKLVTEFFSNQFSYWVSQIDPNLEISIDIENSAQDALSNLQLRISYSFLNGRAKITHDNVQNFKRGNIENSSQVAQAGIGDWTLEYSLLDKSNLKLKVYHRKNNSSSDPNLGGLNNSKNGVSISHTGSSDTLKDIFKRKRRGKK